jgi:hypothetical protein
MVSQLILLCGIPLELFCSSIIFALNLQVSVLIPVVQSQNNEKFRSSKNADCGYNFQLIGLSHNDFEENEFND